ncbi:COG1470 family protein [Streptomyces sp. NPDC002990]
MPVLHTPTATGLGLLLAATVLYAVPAPSATAAGSGWSAEPASATATAPARPSFYLAGAAGTVLEDRLALVNPTDHERTISLRGAGGDPTAEAPRAGATTGAAAWISFGAAATVKLPPRTRAVVPFTLTVPPASTPGDHPAAVVAAEGGREVAVRIHLRVSGPTLAALTVEDVAVRGRGASAKVAYTLVNRGNVTLAAPELAIRPEGRLGEVPGRSAPRALPVELLPGQRVELTEPWPRAPLFDRIDLTLTVTAPGGARATATTSAWFVPWRIAGWTGAGLLALGGTATAALLLVRRRRTTGGDGPPGGQETVAAPVRTRAARAAEPELTGASQ